jgi:hypothetical protein
MTDPERAAMDWLASLPNSPLPSSWWQPHADVLTAMVNELMRRRAATDPRWADQQEREWQRALR